MTDSEDSSRSLLARIGIWGGSIIAGILVLILIAALLIPQFFTSEELKGYVIPPMEEATGRQVEIDEIGLRVLWTPAVAVSGFRLANREGYGPEPAVSAGELNVELALWPLLTGAIEPSAVELVDPVIRYEIAEDGSTNFDDLMAEDTTQAEEDAPLSIPVSNFRTTGAQIRYHDRGTKQALELDFDAQINALPDGNALTSAGTIDVDALRAVLPDVQEDTLTVTDAQITYDARVALADGRIDLSELTIETAPITLSTTGTVTRLNTRPTLDLTVETREADFAQLAAFAPAAAVEGLNPQGTLELTTRVRGPLPDSTESMDSLSVEGTGNLAGIGVDYEGATLLRDLQAEVSLSLDSASLRSIEGQLLGRPLKGSVTVRDPLEEATVNGRLAGSADLAELSALADEDEDFDSLGGTADYEVQFAGPADNPDAILPRGQVRLEAFRYPYEGFRHPVGIPDATVQLTGTGVTMDQFTMRTGEQTMALEMTVRDLFPVSEGLAETDPTMAVDFSMTSDRLDLIELYPEVPERDTSQVYYSQLFAAALSGSTVNGQSPEAVAKKLYGETEVPPYDIDGRVQIATFLNEPQRIDDLALDLRTRDRRMEIRNLEGRTYGGTLAGGITLDQSGYAATSARRRNDGSVLLASRTASGINASGRSAPPSDLQYDIQLEGARASAFLEDWTRLGRVVNGTLDLAIAGDTPLSEGLLPVTDALSAKGTSLVLDGGLSLELGVANQLATTLGLKGSPFTAFQRFGGPFTIEDGVLEMGTWELGGEATNAQLSGALGLGGSVDLTLRMDVPLSTLKNSKIPAIVGGGDGRLVGLVEKLAGSGDGETTIPVRIVVGGTIRDPTVEVVDKEAVRSAIQKRVKQEGMDRVRNLFDGSGE